MMRTNSDPSLKVGLSEDEVAGRGRVFRREELFPQVLELVPAHSILAL